MNSSDGAARTECKSHELQIETGYDFVKEIARGGYGYVYLFTRKQQNEQDYVAGSLFIGMYLALIMTQPALRLIKGRGRG